MTKPVFVILKDSVFGGSKSILTNIHIFVCEQLANSVNVSIAVFVRQS